MTNWQDRTILIIVTIIVIINFTINIRIYNLRRTPLDPSSLGPSRNVTFGPDGRLVGDQLAGVHLPHRTILIIVNIIVN